MTRMIYSTIALLALALSMPASAQTIIVEEDSVQAVPSTETYTYAPGTLQYYNAPRRLYDEDDPSRTANEISPNETDSFLRQMERENRAGNTN